MSFRNRLTIFFIVLVILPMIVVATVGFVLAADSERGKTDARLYEAQRSAMGLFKEFRDRAEAGARAIGQDERLSGAIESGNRDRIQKRLESLAAESSAVRAVMTLDGVGRFEVGRREAVAPARTKLIGAKGASAGKLDVSVITAEDYARLLKRVTGTEAVVTTGRGMAAATLDSAGAKRLPVRGEVDLSGRSWRLTGFDGQGFGDERVSVRLLAVRDSSLLSGAALEVLAILVAALIAAFAFALTVSRSLQSQIERLLTAAKQMTQGDFGVEVPTEGRDEFAQLGKQFNEMARQLERRLEELQLERKRLREAIQRVGQSFGKTLERGALLEIAVQTAVDGVGADAGRAALRTDSHGHFEEVAGEGDVSRFRDVIGAAEAAALDTEKTVETEVGDAVALSHPLRAQDGGRILGMLSVARTGETVQRGRARADRVSRRPGGRLDRERGPARHRQAAGGHG